MVYDLRDIAPTIAKLFGIPPHPSWEGKQINSIVEEMKNSDRIITLLLDGFGFWEYEQNIPNLINFSRFFNQGVMLKIRSCPFPLTPVCFDEIFYGKRRNIRLEEDVFWYPRMSPPSEEDLLLNCVLEKNGIRTAFIGYGGVWTDVYGKYATYKEELEIDWESFFQSHAIIEDIVRSLEADVRCIFAIDTAYDIHGESILEANEEVERLILRLERMYIDEKCGVLVFSDHGNHDKTWQH